MPINRACSTGSAISAAGDCVAAYQAQDAHSALDAYTAVWPWSARRAQVWTNGEAALSQSQHISRTIAPVLRGKDIGMSHRRYAAAVVPLIRHYCTLAFPGATLEYA